MMMKKSIAILLATVMALGMFVGCSDKASTDNKDVSSNEEVKDNAKTEETKKNETKEEKNTNPIQFTFWGSPYEKKVMEAAFAKFESETGYKVEGIHIPADYETKITAMIAGNQDLDAGYLGIPTAYKWHKDGILETMNDIMSKDETFKTDDLVDGAIVYGDNDNVISLFTAIEGYSIIYNKTMFNEAGIQPPAADKDAWTWDEFVEVAKIMTVDNNGNNATDPNFDKESIKQYGVSIPLWFGPLEAMFVKNDGVYVTDEGTTGWVEPEVVDVLQKIQDLMYVHNVMPTPIAKKALPASSISLQTRKYAMVLTGQWDLNSFAQIDGLDVDLSPVPTFGKSDTMLIGSGGMTIYKNSDNKEGAWELIKFLTNPANSIELYRDGLWMPIYKEWYTNEDKVAQWTSNEKARPAAYKDVMMLPVLNNGRYLSELFVNNFKEMHNIINPTLDKVWSGEVDAETALKGVEDELNKLVNGTYGKIK